MSEQDDFDDAALSDETEYEGGHQAANQPHGGVAQHAEDRVAPSDRENDPLDRDFEPSFPARVNVTIEKPGNGAILIQTVAQDGLFQIEEVSYFSQPDLAHAQTAEKDWARQSLYAGPPFENLDEDLQTFLERYLEERGINAELANMIPDYIQVKEQKEYVRWLESKHSFDHPFTFVRLSNAEICRCQELRLRISDELSTYCLMMTRRVTLRYSHLSTLYRPYLIVQNLVTGKQFSSGLLY